MEGTTLAEIFHVDLTKSPLWSGKSAADEPDVLLQAHLAFLQAGARTLLTSTYQSSYATFERAGYSREIAAQRMRDSVKIAMEAKVKFCSGNKDVKLEDVHIALSLGTFGASLSPMQDFGGVFPPPYGPKAYSATGQEENTNSFDDDREGKERSIEALAQFHAERLLVFAQDRETWESIDCLAFETIPLEREVRAIRRAVGTVVNSSTQNKTKLKPWWITMVFPGGQYPEKRSPHGESYTVAELVATALQVVNSDLEEPLPTPNGIGINCTGLRYLHHLLPDFEASVALYPREPKPWLILHPNKGDGYDSVSKTWRMTDTSVSWADEFAEIVKGMKQDVFGGIIAGGCCKAGPEEIRGLRINLNLERNLK
ncbi:Homocysteine S-methyltransferase [Hygrophoropsis aurantiaca]|uniref:Homocysteine S-methyltransferase n=1 Tax=Hygrophoropsis aurantiaca TaxID=72124 RepID=A0ACB8AGE8_9AGAM|nr:Homocysteine S-methyltransferase [Hygrophoropsis aurantiaca]